jgi:putative transposase
VKKSRFTEEQIAFALKQAETGTPVAEVLRRMGISEQTCLTLEEALRRAGYGRAATSTAVGGGKPQAQAACGRSEPRQAHPVRHVLAKKL